MAKDGNEKKMYNRIHQSGAQHGKEISWLEYTIDPPRLSTLALKSERTQNIAFFFRFIQAKCEMAKTKCPAHQL